MNRKSFEQMSFEDQLKYVNDRSRMKTAKIADEIGMPASSLSKIFAERGYRRLQGIYQKGDKTTRYPAVKADSLRELIPYKEELMRIAKGERLVRSENLDFSVLEQFEAGKKKTITFDMPADISAKLDRELVKRGCKKQSLLNLLIYRYLASQSE